MDVHLLDFRLELKVVAARLKDASLAEGTAENLHANSSEYKHSKEE
jgi:hypothetical protein